MPWVGEGLGTPLSLISKSFVFHKVIFIVFLKSVALELVGVMLNT